jgi:uncharacterized coiled-coil protein SlyX
MFNIFKKNHCKERLMQLELQMEHQQNQISEMREIILQLVKDINSLSMELTHLTSKTKSSI